MKISFQFSDHEFSIEIISKYTCFIGKDSGDGKTELLSLIEKSFIHMHYQIFTFVHCVKEVNLNDRYIYR